MNEVLRKMNRYIFGVVIFIVAFLPFCKYKTVFENLTKIKKAKSMENHENCFSFMNPKRTLF